MTSPNTVPLLETQPWKLRFFFGIATIVISLLDECPSAQAADTEYNLGVQAYREKDYATARQHWASAVEQGEISALNNLGFLLYNGLGGEPDQARAVSLWG